MAKSKYVSLHTHTDFSYKDSICKIPALVARAKELGYPALAITDHGNISGAIAFYKECKKQDIKPIIGIEFYINECSEDKDRSAHHITVLAMNNVGLENLVRLVSWSNQHGFYYSPRIDLEQLEKHNEGIIVLSGCMQGLIAQAIINNNIEKAEELSQWFQGVFGDRFYIELQQVNRKNRVYIPEQNIILEESRRIAKKFGIKTVATNDTHYLHKEDKLTHEIWKAVSVNMTLKTPPKTADNPKGRLVFNGEDYYLQTEKEMLERFTKEEVRRSCEIANRCNVTIDIDAKPSIPRYKNMSDNDAFKLLTRICKQYIKERKIFTRDDSEYVERLRKELKDIKEANLAHYFLLVHDVIQYADKRGIKRGAGRGSVSGSLTAYILGIHRINPIQHKLIWERFYNPGRAGSMPDIDLDFDINRRKEIVEYLKEQFGADKIYPMSTIHALAGKMALKDVGRALGIDYKLLNKITAKFPHKCHTIADAIEQVEEIKQYSEGIDADVKKWEKKLKTETNKDATKQLENKISERKTELRMLFRHALKIEGCARHRGTHACATFVTDKNIHGTIPLTYDSKNKEMVTGWDMYVLEELGYLKLDVLGLKAVTVIDNIRKEIIRRGDNPRIEKSEACDDPYIFNMISDGRTTGIFQLESYLGRAWARKVRPSNIQEWADVIALIRPAALETGMSDAYIKAKNTGCIEYVHDDLKEVLGATYGMAIHQESVIAIAQKIAGFSLEKSDLVRYHLSKKHEDKIKSLKDDFIEGCISHGKCSQEVADKLWNIIEAGTGYGFNKCLIGNTVVKLANGNCCTIEDIKDKEDVILCSFSYNGEIVPNNLIQVIDAGKQNVYECIFDNNANVFCTLNHKFMCTDWKYYTILEILRDRRQVVNAGSIIKIEYAGQQQTYNLEMEAPNHNYILANGLISKNSHAMSYATLGYILAFYKFYYPQIFYKEMLSAAMHEGKTHDEVNKLYFDAMYHNVTVMPPSLQYCNPECAIHNDSLYYGFLLIKSVGKRNMKKIAVLRGVKTMHELRQRILENNITIGVIMPLLWSGVFDYIIGAENRMKVAAEFEVFYGLTLLRRRKVFEHENELADIIPDSKLFIEALKIWMRDKEKAFERNQVLNSNIRRLIDWDEAGYTNIAFIAEKELDHLGVCISCCRADAYDAQQCHRVGDLRRLPERATGVTLACLDNVRDIHSKKGNKLVIADIYDTTGKMTAMLVGENYEKYKKSMYGVRILSGQVQNGNFIIKKIKNPVAKT